MFIGIQWIVGGIAVWFIGIVFNEELIAVMGLFLAGLGTLPFLKALVSFLSSGERRSRANSNRDSSRHSRSITSKRKHFKRAIILFAISAIMTAFSVFIGLYKNINPLLTFWFLFTEASAIPRFIQWARVDTFHFFMSTLPDILFAFGCWELLRSFLGGKTLQLPSAGISSSRPSSDDFNDLN